MNGFFAVAFPVQWVFLKVTDYALPLKTTSIEAIGGYKLYSSGLMFNGHVWSADIIPEVTSFSSLRDIRFTGVVDLLVFCGCFVVVLWLFSRTFF